MAQTPPWLNSGMTGVFDLVVNGVQVHVTLELGDVTKVEFVSLTNEEELAQFIWEHYDTELARYAEQDGKRV
jgi:hypothetical protein